ncbi:hypothetical protein QQS21_010431 [Conoideocrella luteorostrata]|uniref:FAD-binding PCMH-type domain-containing protein n=1 Tax=Conoideocrella luteorostrata TaxID=1105319 RepID=A0AAJ0CF75_9HYPO|nr:hypothetical protein QQS21_010431 [Conoideocrella luteorostrata]
MIFSIFAVICLIAAAASANANPLIEGDCIRSDPGLRQLSRVLSNKSAISCLGQPLQRHNSNRYWGTQFGKNASVVVYPSTTKDVSLAVQAANRSPLGQDFAFVGGGHSQINASSAYGLVLDLSWMNKSRVILDFQLDNSNIKAVEYEGGSNWGQVQATTNGTGYTAVGARVASVGAGGFSLGGGIGFLAGAYGFATDRLVRLEVVLPSGEIVLASKHNRYSDLFWALQGGSGQFGIVTRFWQEAVPEPKKSYLGFYYIDDNDVERLQNQTVKFFENNKDPFSVIYYGFGFLPADLANPTPESYAKRTLLITVYFENPENPNQLSYNQTFDNFFTGINTTNSTVIQSDYYSNLVFVGQAAYPYGYRRGFYGAQTTKIDVKYLSDLTTKFYSYLDEMQKRGEKPYSASFIVQYMFPTLNGHVPKSDADTAWPHSVVGHQTLFTPAYLDKRNDELTLSTVRALNKISYDKQAELGEFVGDYPNYISPGERGRRVWGDNVKRLIRLKQKYDPQCLIRNGLVFSSKGCVEGGWGNIFSD